MNKKLILTLLALFIVVGAGVIAFAFSTNQTNSTSSNQDNTQNDEQSSPDGKSVTVSGKMTCLSPKDTSGPVDSSCAIGLEGDDGKNYALTAADPSLTGGAPMGQRVRITGNLTEQTSNYDAVGIIKVDSLQRL